MPAWSPLQVQTIMPAWSLLQVQTGTSMVTASGSDWCQNGHQFRFRLLPAWSPLQVQTVVSMVNTLGSDYCQHDHRFSGSDYIASMVTASGSDWYQHGYRFRFRLVPEWLPLNNTALGSDCCRTSHHFRFRLLPAWSLLQVQTVASMVTTSGQTVASMLTAPRSLWPYTAYSMLGWASQSKLPSCSEPPGSALEVWHDSVQPLRVEAPVAKKKTH